jgi:dTDP-4-dehydrorhamnose reductase
LEQGRPKILITGASGFLGREICRLAVEQWSVTGIYHRHPFNIRGVESVQADLTDDAQVKSVLAAVNPRAVIHALETQSARRNNHRNFLKMGLFV